MSVERTALVDRLKESHSTTRDVVDGVDSEFPVHTDTGWTVRDILGHIGAWDIQAEGSLVGVTWVILGSDFTGTAADARVAIVTATPWVRLWVEADGSPAWEISMEITE